MESEANELGRAMSMIQSDNYTALRNFRELFDRTDLDDYEKKLFYAEKIEECEQAIDRLDNIAFMNRGCYQKEAREIIKKVMGAA